MVDCWLVQSTAQALVLISLTGLQQVWYLLSKAQKEMYFISKNIYSHLARKPPPQQMDMYV